MDDLKEKLRSLLAEVVFTKEVHITNAQWFEACKYRDIAENLKKALSIAEGTEPHTVELCRFYPDGTVYQNGTTYRSVEEWVNREKDK